MNNGDALLQLQEVEPDVVLDVPEDPAAGAVQERRVQHRAGQRVQAAATVHAGPVHHAGGRAVAVDAARVLRELLPQLAGVRRRVVPDRVHARRPRRGERQEPRVVAVRDQRAHAHGQLPVQRGDAAHHRLRVPHDHRGVPRGRRALLLAEHRRPHDPGAWTAARQPYGLRQTRFFRTTLVREFIRKNHPILIPPRAHPR